MKADITRVNRQPITNTIMTATRICETFRNTRSIRNPVAWKQKRTETCFRQIYILGLTNYICGQ